MKKMTFKIPFNYAMGILHDHMMSWDLITIGHKIFMEDIKEYEHFLNMHRAKDLFPNASIVGFIAHNIDQDKIKDIMNLRPTDKVKQKEAAFLCFVCGMFRHFSTPKE